MVLRQPWPEEGLEECSRCPVCDSEGRLVWAKALTDRYYGCAPGEWDVYRCSKCGTGYLDPRPSRDTLPLAYAGYYTHTEVNLTDIGRYRGTLRRIKVGLRDGYLNFRFGLQLDEPWILGRILVPLIPGWGRRYRRWARLPLPHENASLLDVGAGSGYGVAHFRSLGWHAQGIDVDAAAVEQAQAASLPVINCELASVEGRERFDAVTMSHSIEHLHDPIETLLHAWRLLKPGGAIELATPNLESFGSRIYRDAWFGLDPPRHLVLFTPKGIIVALSRSGFEQIKFHEPYNSPRRSYRASAAVRLGTSWVDGARPTPVARAALAATRFLGRVYPRLGDELLVTARKPR